MSGVLTVGAAAAITSAPAAFASACSVSVKAVTLTRAKHPEVQTGPLAFTGANVITALVIAGLLLGLGTLLVALARRGHGRMTAPVLATGFVALLVVGGVAVDVHSATAATTVAGACAPAGSAPGVPPITVVTPVTVAGTTAGQPGPNAGTGAGTVNDPGTGTDPAPPPVLPEAPMPVALLVAGLGTGAWMWRRHTRPGL